MYINQLEKDITKKINEKGYNVKVCKVNAKISDKEEETKITEIKVEVEKAQTNAKEENLENKIVSRNSKNKTS